MTIKKVFPSIILSALVFLLSFSYAHAETVTEQWLKVSIDDTQAERAIEVEKIYLYERAHFRTWDTVAYCAPNRLPAFMMGLNIGETRRREGFLINANGGQSIIKLSTADTFCEYQLDEFEVQFKDTYSDNVVAVFRFGLSSHTTVTAPTIRCSQLQNTTNPTSSSFNCDRSQGKFFINSKAKTFNLSVIFE